jgi:hypothetical protein
MKSFITLILFSIFSLLTFSGCSPTPKTQEEKLDAIYQKAYVWHKAFQDPLFSATVTFYGNSTTPTAVYTSLGHVSISKEGARFIDKTTKLPVELQGTFSVTRTPLN